MIGTTFSQLQCQYLKLDPVDTFKEVLNLNFKILRLCCYWNEVEKEPGKFDFSLLDKLIELASEKDIDLILTVGMKAPRYPEYHIPEWVEDKDLEKLTLKFIRKVVNQYKNKPKIKYFQVENEPLNTIVVTKKPPLSYELVEKEVLLVRELKREDQRVVLTSAIDMWPNPEHQDEKIFEESLSLADIVGLNVYKKIGTNSGFYLNPHRSYWKKLKKWLELGSIQGKEVWVSECQAEPWEEWENEVIHIKQTSYPSFSPSDIVIFTSKLNDIGFKTLLLWGVEHWIWHNKHGNNDWIRSFLNL